MGGKIYCGTHVNDVQGGDPAKGEKCKVSTDSDAEVESAAVLVATNTPTPINDWAGIYTKQASYRTYVIGCPIPRGVVSDALYWDMGEVSKSSNAYHYIRLDKTDKEDEDLLLIGGSDHKVGQYPTKHPPFEELEKWTCEHFPKAGPITTRWSGQVQEPEDAMAYIGQAPTAKPNVYVITGDSGMGLTHASLGAILIRDLIFGRENPWKELYSPTRKPTATPYQFVKENLNAAATYVDYVSPGSVSKEEDIAPGEGATLREGLKIVACYRDEDGSVHKMSTTCPHLGCSVRWNPEEKSWDCPCHGSRFGPTGDVVMGPATEGLKRIG